MAEYHLTYDQEQELTRRLGNDPSATYGFLNQGRTTYAARGPDVREARRQIEIGLQEDSVGRRPEYDRRIAATIREEPKNPFTPFHSQRSTYVVTTNDPQVMEQLRQMGLKPVPPTPIDGQQKQPPRIHT
ncbi:MAG TPA: hypothetical protein VLD37_02560 [Candidatus Bilamarchaeum sp.]|nr:hypothetical protein [Candidatus Bilamarchaeum sp.]